jgi:hypothetical protein
MSLNVPISNQFIRRVQTSASKRSLSKEYQQDRKSLETAGKELDSAKRANVPNISAIMYQNALKEYIINGRWKRGLELMSEMEVTISH